jgi:hypothetical protein
MATKKKSEPEAQPGQPLNREERRRAKFGKAGKVHQHNPLGPWPEIEANPALKDATGDQAAPTGVADQAATPKTSPGTGGATESADPAPAVKAAKPRTKPKG